MKKLSPDDLEILVALLARTDALHEPCRSAGRPLPQTCWAAIAERQRAYAARGLPLVGGGGGAERKRHERHLTALESAGLLRTFSKNGRRASAKLTPRGDDVCCWLAATQLYHQSWHYLARMVELIDAGQSRGDSVPETWLGGFEYDDLDAVKKINDLECDLLPLTCRGMVSSWPDTVGRLYWRLEPAGRTAVAAGPPEPPDDLPSYDDHHPPRWPDFHQERWSESLAERLRWAPEGPRSVMIPMSAGVWPGNRPATATTTSASSPPGRAKKAKAGDTTPRNGKPRGTRKAPPPSTEDAANG